MTHSGPTAAAPAVQRLAVPVLLAYSAAQFGLSAMNTLVATQIPFFYVDTLALPAASFGVVMLVSKLWNAIADPVVGHVTDNTRHRLGRRRPYFLIGAAPLALLTWLLFSPPQRTGDALFGWFLVCFLGAFTARSVFETPYQALAPELTRDYDERTRLAAWRVTIGNVGDLTGAIAPMLLLAVLAPRVVFDRVGLAAAGVILVTALIAFAGVRESGDTRELPRKRLLPNLLQIAGFPLRNPPARMLILAYACAVAATTIPTAVFRFVNRYVFTATGLEGTLFGPLIERIGTAAFLDIAVIVGYFTGVFCSAPLWARALRTRDKKHGYLFAFFYMGAVVSGVFAIPRELGILFVLLNLFAGAGALGLWMMPAAIGPDVVEWEELHHGERHEGGFYGLWMLVQKTGAGFALFAMGILLDGVGFVPGAEQTPGSVFGLRCLYGGTPLVIGLLGAALFWRYPLTRAVYADVRRQLDARTRRD